METYYSKKEFNEMKKSYEKRIKLLEKQVERLTNKNKQKDVTEQ
jgi:hypothetical protein